MACSKHSDLSMFFLYNRRLVDYIATAVEGDKQHWQRFKDAECMGGGRLLGCVCRQLVEQHVREAKHNQTSLC